MIQHTPLQDNSCQVDFSEQSSKTTSQEQTLVTRLSFTVTIFEEPMLLFSVTWPPLQNDG